MTPAPSAAIPVPNIVNFGDAELGIIPTDSQTELQVGPAGSNRGKLGPVPAPVARGCHGPPNTLLLAL